MKTPQFDLEFLQSLLAAFILHFIVHHSCHRAASGDNTFPKCDFYLSFFAPAQFPLPD